jgi:hypothetical protein
MYKTLGLVSSTTKTNGDGDGDGDGWTHTHKDKQKLKTINLSDEYGPCFLVYSKRE